MNKETLKYNLLGFIQQVYPIGQLFLTRYFIDPIEFGRWTAINVLVSFILIFDIGLAQVLQQKFPKKAGSNIINRILAEVRALIIIISLLLTGVFILYLLFFEKELFVHEKILAVILFLLMYYNNFLISFNRTFKKYERISKASFYYFITNFTILVITLPFIGYLGLYISIVSSLCLSVSILNKYDNQTFFKFRYFFISIGITNYQKRLVKLSLRLKGVEFPLLFLNIADMMFVKYFFSFEQLSFYSTAKSIATAIKKSLSWIKTRDIINTYSIKGEKNLAIEKKKIVKSILKENIIIIPIIIVAAYYFCLFSFDLFFPEYSKAVNLIPIICLPLFCRGVQEQYRTIDFSRNKIRSIFTSNLVGTISLLAIIGVYYINANYDMKLFSFLYVVGIMIATFVLIFNTTSYTYIEKFKVAFSVLIPYLIISLLQI